MGNARAAVAAPDPVWVCRESGAVAMTWSAISPTGHFDSMEWRRPNYVPAAELPNPIDAVALLDGPANAEDLADDAPLEGVDVEFLPPPDAPAAEADASKPAKSV